jgi:hypothetical protein
LPKINVELKLITDKIYKNYENFKPEELKLKLTCISSLFLMAPIPPPRLLEAIIFGERSQLLADQLSNKSKKNVKSEPTNIGFLRKFCGNRVFCDGFLQAMRNFLSLFEMF